MSRLRTAPATPAGLERRSFLKLAAAGAALVTGESSEVVPGAFGEMIEINLKGVGWTETADIYDLVFDNAFLGYSCGFTARAT